MGKNSELQIEMNENSEIDSVEMSAKKQLIEQFEKKKVRLSYSSLKKFTSPINLVNHKLKPYKANAGMMFGSLCDTLLMTPHLFDSEFAIVSKAPTTDKQIDYCDEIIDFIKSKRKSYKLKDADIEKIYSNHYSKGDAFKLYESLKKHISSAVNNQQSVSQDLYDEAKQLIDNLKENEDVAELLSQIQDVQVKVQWSDFGWKFLGFLDMLLVNDHIIDGKYSKDADPDKFIRDIQNMDYFLQGAMYCIGTVKAKICKDPKYSWLVYDKTGNYSIIELDYSYFEYGKRKYTYLMEQLNRCAEQKAFTQSYNFFKRTYKAIKPGWAKGFILNDDNE